MYTYINFQFFGSLMALLLICLSVSFFVTHFVTFLTIPATYSFYF